MRSALIDALQARLNTESLADKLERSRARARKLEAQVPLDEIITFLPPDERPDVNIVHKCDGADLRLIRKAAHSTTAILIDAAATPAVESQGCRPREVEARFKTLPGRGFLLGRLNDLDVDALGKLCNGLGVQRVFCTLRLEGTVNRTLLLQLKVNELHPSIVDRSNSDPTWERIPTEGLPRKLFPFLAAETARSSDALATVTQTGTWRIITQRQRWGQAAKAFVVKPCSCGGELRGGGTRWDYCTTASCNNCDRTVPLSRGVQERIARERPRGPVPSY